ncbi:hypothetical protein OR16_15533 [Cupriavidus basilensis OR16]|uniref:Uncharacterized protein n=1 Tax=Cupriavidus basilensis OR16 TaxID=1127483 RepID=H1S5I4_9BURK|nr:hypothetical protein [Cupriavidus basilensis]EHP42210.1 hypothetical protein OR16_15533 [Cupriavidus basilensis OR16]
MSMRKNAPAALLAILLCAGVGVAGAASRKSSASGKGQSAQSGQSARQSSRNSVLPSNVRK